MRRALVAGLLLLVGLLVVPASGAVRTYTFSVRAEGVSGDLEHVAAVTHSVLNDPRGWSLGGSIAFQRVASGGSLVVVLAAPSVVDAAAPVCDATYSCRVGNRVYLNDVRWRTATPSWPHGLAEYQRYVVQHEVGHWLGLGHTSCPAAGRAAPVMQQQSISLQGCAANVWPLMEEREAVGRLHGVPVQYLPTEHAYHALGRSSGVVGGPITWPRPTGDGVGLWQFFVRGAIFSSPATGAHEVHGAVRQRYAELGYERGPLRYPTTHELGTPDGRGRYNHFSGGSVYWTPETGAWDVRGAIRSRWAAMRWEAGPLGYPVTGERVAPDQRGRYSHFARGSVYWTPETGAWDVRGAVRSRWAALRWEAGPLGYPVSGELGTPDGVGRYNHFARGSVYWTRGGGAHEVLGKIRDRWAAMRWEAGPLGYPVTGQYAVPGGARSDFQGGSITLDAATGTTEVHLTG